MRVLLNCLGFLKPATIITEKEWFSECQYPLFIADIRNLDYQIKRKKIRLQIIICCLISLYISISIFPYFFIKILCILIIFINLQSIHYRSP